MQLQGTPSLGPECPANENARIRSRPTFCALSRFIGQDGTSSAVKKRTRPEIRPLHFVAGYEPIGLIDHLQEHILEGPPT